MRAEIERVLKDPGFASEYRVLSREGEGGMGMVFKAIQTSLNRTVAVKILLPSLFSDPDVARRLEREAQLTSDLKKHENIVRLLTFGRVGTLPYVVYEFVEGESLAHVIHRDAPLPLTRALDLQIQLLNGLAHAHKHRIIHRDIKPENVLLDKFGYLKVMDFGIALEESGGERLTRAGVIIGTPVYMAPEQAAGGEVTPLVDVYASAVILYEMLSGGIPWEQEAPLAILAEKVSGRFIPLAEVAPNVPEVVTKLVDRTLARDPADRPQTAQAFRQELEKIQSALSSTTGVISVQPKPADKPRVPVADTAQFGSGVSREAGTQSVEATTPAVRLSRELKPVARSAAAVFVMALLVASSFWMLATSRARKVGDPGFHSVSAAFRDESKVAVAWLHPGEAEALAELYRTDGGGEVLKSPMREAGPGRYEAIFEGVDPFLSYSFKVLIPSSLGATQASEPQVLEGAGAVVEKLRQATEALDPAALGRKMLRARQQQTPAPQVASDILSGLYRETSLLERLDPVAPVLWDPERLKPMERWAVIGALAKLQELEWRAAALGVKLRLGLERIQSPDFAAAKGSLDGASVECALPMEGEGGVVLRPGVPVKFSLAGCPSPAAVLGQISVRLTGLSSRPYFLSLEFGSWAKVALLGADSSPVTLFHTIDPGVLKPGPGGNLTVTLREMDLLTRPPDNPGLRLSEVVVRSR